MYSARPYSALPYSDVLAAQTISGAIVQTQDDQTISATGTVRIAGSIIQTQDDQTIVATGTVSGLPPSPVITPQRYGFDAGPGFGQWFQRVYGTTSSSSSRRPERRDTEIGRILDELVYGTEPDLEPEDADEAAEIVADAVQAVARRGEAVRDEREAMALVQGYSEAYRVVLNVAAAEAWKLFLGALARQARAEWEASVARRIRQDDDDLMILAEYVF